MNVFPYVGFAALQLDETGWNTFARAHGYHECPVPQSDRSVGGPRALLDNDASRLFTGKIGEMVKRSIGEDCYEQITAYLKSCRKDGAAGPSVVRVDSTRPDGENAGVAFAHWSMCVPPSEQRQRGLLCGRIGARNAIKGTKVLK